MREYNARNRVHFINANRSVEANTELPAAHHHHFFSPLNVFIWAAFRATRQKPGETRKFPPDLRRRATQNDVPPTNGF